MTNEEKATALKKLVNTLAKEGDQWLLQEPFIWEKQAEWELGDVTPYPEDLDIPPTKKAFKASAAIAAIINGSIFKDTFTSVFRQGDFMVLSIPDLYDIMVPFTRSKQVWLSKGVDDCFGHIQPYYDVYPNTHLWVNGETVTQDKKALAEAGLQVEGSWYARGGGIAYRCQPKQPIISLRQEGKNTGWPIHGPIWASPTCIFYK